MSIIEKIQSFPLVGKKDWQCTGRVSLETRVLVSTNQSVNIFARSALHCPSKPTFIFP